MVILISIATKAELLSLGIQNGWGTKKIKALSNLLDKLFIIDINNSDKQLIDSYSKIDAYSQGRLPGKTLGISARNMGKNDLWIAAAAYVANAELVTADGDFDHLKDDWIRIHKY